MGKKDLSEKKLEDINDVFADILNVLLFKEKYLNPYKLLDGAIESIYKAETGGLKAQCRDTIKYYQNAGIVISSFGIENQSTIDADMPIRVMGYDYASYRRQMDTDCYRFPVITVVLNFSDKKWDKPTHLRELLKIPKGMGEFVQDYEARVFDIAFLPDEIIGQFHSTFKQVAHFFSKRKALDYEPLDEKIDDLGELLDFLSVFTGDNHYNEIKDILIKRQKKGESITMCNVVERFTNEGLIKGREEGQSMLILKMLKKGIPMEEVSNMTDIPVEEILKMKEPIQV